MIVLTSIAVEKLSILLYLIQTEEVKSLPLGLLDYLLPELEDHWKHQDHYLLHPQPHHHLNLGKPQHQ